VTHRLAIELVAITQRSTNIHGCKVKWRLNGTGVGIMLAIPHINWKKSTMSRKDTLVGRVVSDARGAEYTVKTHHVEADELVLERGAETQAITMMDIANGRFRVLNDE